MAEFAGKVAVITGGARGFGRGFGEALANRGAMVVLADIDGRAADDAARAIGANAQSLALDVADNAAVEAAMAAVASEHRGIDILINNAGIHSLAASKPIRQLGLEAARRMFEVNVWGVIQCTLSAAPFMAGREGAAIVNIASMAAYTSASAYGVTKLAVRGITADFARDLAPIRVNAIAPGLMFTDTIRAELPQPIIDAVRAQQIVKREGTLADVVEAMLYLVSPRSGFTTGETLKVTGGVTLQV
jgi:3-oxoacyl-[acyl-carrier protein] reductase